jgi:hypothetical protein
LLKDIIKNHAWEKISEKIWPNLFEAGIFFEYPEKRKWFGEPLPD